MLTKVVLSNISYNTENFLVEKLNKLLKAKKINFWAYIKHEPEIEEGKAHIHLLLIPNQRLETSDLDDMFVEDDPYNELPLKCMLWTPVKNINDWFLYCVHDKTYVKKKHKEDKLYHYSIDDFKYSDRDIFKDFIFKAYHEYDFWATDKYIQMFDQGVKASDLVRRGYISMNEMINFSYFIKSLSADV